MLIHSVFHQAFFQRILTASAFEVEHDQRIVIADRNLLADAIAALGAPMGVNVYGDLVGRGLAPGTADPQAILAIESNRADVGFGNQSAGLLLQRSE